MKYTTRILAKELIKKYDNIIAWGCGPLYSTHYRPDYFSIDGIVDGTGKNVGKEIQGRIIQDVAYLESLEGKILVIIYTIYEKQVEELLETIKNYENIDTIVFSLLDIVLENSVHMPALNAKNGEDALLFLMIQELGLQEISFLEIGVCHPVMRNNTFLLSELYAGTVGYKGVLVEANPLCWDLIRQYRPMDKLISKGVCEKEGGEQLPFYIFPNLLGHSTFLKEIAETKASKGFVYEEKLIETTTINQVIYDNFETYPQILSIDAEGMDYVILNSWDDKKYPIKIIISEIMKKDEEMINVLMEKKGYEAYARTIENILWVKK